MEQETINKEMLQLSNEEKILQKKKQNNVKIYKFYRIFSWDMLFYYAIIYLFLTIEKKITPAQALQFDAFYIFFKFILEIPCALTIQKMGKRNGLIIANIVVTIHILFIIFARNFATLIFSQFLCAYAFSIKSTCETDMLYDSLEHNEKRGSIFAKIDGKASGMYYYIDAISAILSSFLFVINSYLPLVICFIILLLTFFISTKFEDIQNKKETTYISEEIKKIKYGFRKILKSKRLKNLLIFNGLFVGLTKILQNIRNTELLEIGVPEQYFGTIFGVMGIISGIATRNQWRIHKKYRNRTLSVLALPTTFSCLISGFILLSNFSYEVKFRVLLIMYAIQYIAKGPYYVLIKRYFNNFTTSEKRIQISTANSLCENAIASSLIFIASFILERITIGYTTLIIGCIFTIAFVLLLDHMRHIVGLKPEEYSSKEIL